MLNIVACIKQVPMVTELPWDEKTGTLRRDLAAGMMNPACKLLWKPPCKSRKNRAHPSRS